MFVLRVDTDCSGIETPIMALQKLKIPRVHVFSSEIDPAARLVILKRCHKTKPPKATSDRFIHSGLPLSTFLNCSFDNLESWLRVSSR